MAPQTPPTDLPDWDLYRALREQWTHEDNLVNHRLMRLILSQGLRTRSGHRHDTVTTPPAMTTGSTPK